MIYVYLFFFRFQEKLTDVLDTELDLEGPGTTDDQSSLYFGTRSFLFFTTDDNFGSADDRFGNSQRRKFEVTRILLFLGIFLVLAALFFVILSIILIGCESEPPQHCYWRYGRPF